MAFFGILSIYDTLHDFLRAFQICLQNFSISIRADFRGGASDAPPSQKVVENKAHRNRVNVIQSTENTVKEFDIRANQTF